MDSPITRVFLGWDRPALHAAADHLLQQVQDGDLSNCLIVMPGGRAARLLLGELLERGSMLSPPRFCTPGQLAEFLFPPDLAEGEAKAGSAPAGPMLKRLAWAAALKGAKDLAALVPHRPAAEDTGAWWRIAGMLEQVHAELSGELILFDEVPERAAAAGNGGGFATFPDAARWAAAAEVQRRFEALLSHGGLFDADLRMLRLLRAQESPESTPMVQRVVLIGVSELPRAGRRALERFLEVASRTGATGAGGAGAGGPGLPGCASHAAATVDSLVFAPESLAARFDEFGAVVPEQWKHVDVPEVRFGQGPAEQADLALEAAAALEGRYAAHEIVIGVPDDEVVPYLERKAAQIAAVEVRGRERHPESLRVRAATGWPLGQTAPFRLLEGIGDFVDEGSFASLAAIVRHPDIEAHLLRASSPEIRGQALESWLDAMDRYQMSHVPGALDGEWLAEDPLERRTLADVHGQILNLTAEFREGPASRPLAAWAGPIRAVMSRVYSQRRLSRGDPAQRRTIEGNVAIRDALVELERAGAAAPSLLPPCSAPEAIDILLEIAGSGSVPEEGDEECIELLGWLELPLDPAPVAIITGLNEGKVPASIAGDAFLPDGLREALAISSSSRRLARDLYSLAALAASRQHLVLIAGRSGADHSPLLPSRLLFACNEKEIVERVRLFTGDRAPASPRPRLVLRVQPGRQSQFHDLPVVATEPVISMRVTSFRTFLASPYLFYLEHVLGLQEREDGCLELDPLAYGSLIHDVLERFGKSDVRHAADQATIETCVLDELATLARERFGQEPSTCIWLQLEFARRRLREFARFQAQRRRQGWLIEYTEWRPPGGPAVFMVDGEPFGLRGKIDRIERHETTGVWAVLDYKTGDSVPDPASAHRGMAGWRDLQLPLYRHLASQLRLPIEADRLVLGYIALPKKPGGVQVLTADWDAAALEEADEAAREVVRRVRAGAFLDIGDRPPEDGIMAALSGVGFVGSGRRRRAGDGEGDEP